MQRVAFSGLYAAEILTIALASAVWLSTALPSSAEKKEPILLEPAFAEVVPPPSPRHEYVEVVEGCGPHYGGDECVYARAGPGDDYRIIESIRRGVVLKVEPVFEGLRPWYRVLYEPVRYPERLSRSTYVSALGVRHFYADGVEEFDGHASTTKYILVDRSSQRLYAYEGETLFMEVVISTGLDITPTPRGTFTIYRKTPSRYMQGPLPGISDQYYDLPGVPWNLYFTPEGGVIHGAYWHEGFGKKWSHGCVNVPLAEARALYEWAELGTRVIVRD